MPRVSRFTANRAAPIAAAVHWSSVGALRHLGVAVTAGVAAALLVDTTLVDSALEVSARGGADDEQAARVRSTTQRAAAPRTPLND
jgi:hypothetical protein